MHIELLPIPPSELGESPFWHPDEQRLYWCDIQAHCIRAWTPSSGEMQAWPMPSEPGCCAPAPGGKLVIGLRDGMYLLDTRSSDLQCLTPLPHDTSVLRLNDGRCDTAGRFWAGSVFSPKTAPLAELWRLQATARGYQVQRMAGDNLTANGLAFSPDNRWMYWAHTGAHRIDRFAFDLATGTISNRQPWVQFPPKTEGQPYGGRPDGACVDVEGHYWVAMYEGGCVLRLAPSGAVVQRVELPLRCPTMPCLGGADGRTLYITSARHGRPASELEGPAPAGSLLSLRVDVPGLPVNFFKPKP